MLEGRLAGQSEALAVGLSNLQRAGCRLRLLSPRGIGRLGTFCGGYSAQDSRLSRRRFGRRCIFRLYDFHYLGLRPKQSFCLQARLINLCM